MKITSALSCTFALLFSAQVFGQTTVPNAGLNYIQTITLPNLTSTGSTQANFDIFGFNPQTRVMYYADRVNKAIGAIDTRMNTYLGSLLVPGNPTGVNGALVAGTLQQLVVTDGKSNVFVYDLRVPGSAPDVYALPGIGGGTDALDYDPLNHTVYVINGSAPYYLTGINLLSKSIASQFHLPGSPELLKFSPVDGRIYQVITDSDNQNKNAGLLAYDPVANAQMALYPSNCTPHGIGIDPIANTALLGCGTNQGQVLMSLQDGTIIKTFPDVTGTDLLDYNPNNRRFYTGSTSKATTSSCPSDTTGNTYPIIGVIDAGSGTLAGVQCAGRVTKVGVDPIQNFVYAGVRQYPADPASQTTGVTGIAVFQDPAPPAQPLTNQSQAKLTAMGSSPVGGTVLMRMEGRAIRMDANLTGVNGLTATVVVATTVGNESIECKINYQAGSAVCNGNLLGDPMVGGPVLIGVDGVPAARGTVATISN